MPSEAWELLIEFMIGSVKQMNEFEQNENKLEFSLDDFEAIWADRKHFLQQQKTQVLWRQNLQSFLNDDGWK